MDNVDCDLLVVGMGPAGDSLAALASLHGLKVIAVDKAEGIFPLPRAAVFDDEIMRIFQMMGMSERIAPLCGNPDRYQFLTVDKEVLLDFPVKKQGLYGWAETYSLHQPGVEAVLRERLSELDVDMRVSTKFEAVEQDGDGVTVTLSNAEGEYTLRTRYVVGCDGASSLVRETMETGGIFDYQFDEPWLVLDTITQNPEDLPKIAVQICDPKRPITHLAMGGARLRWEFMMKPGETEEQMLDDAFIYELLEPWDVRDRLEIERKAVYRFHGLVTNKWLDGRVLLAGDAAHQMPPFAGQGMCSAIRDSCNLAWKLAEVVHGRAPKTLLETYQTEREPHVRAIIETAIAMGKVVCILDEEAAAKRNEGMLARKQAGAQDINDGYPPLSGGLLTSTPMAGSLLPQPVEQGHHFDDLIGLNAAIIGFNLPALNAEGVTCIDLSSPNANAYASAYEPLFKELGEEAVLVRPDRHIYGSGKAEELLQLWQSQLQGKQITI